MNAKTVLATASIAAIACVSSVALADSADQHLNQIVGSVQQSVARASGDVWENRLLPQASGSFVASADAQLEQIVAGYKASQDPTTVWANALRPQASGTYLASADEHMTQLMAGFTQQQLDGFGFTNTVMQQYGYAAGHPFEVVLVGSGTTQGSTPEVAVAADTLVQRIVAGYTRGILDRGGWVNAYVDSPNYSAGNMLASVQVGDGVTTQGAQV